MLKVLFQGDSITDTLHNRNNPRAHNGLGSGYVLLTASYMLERYPEAGLEFYNRGIGGNRITDLLCRWYEDCLNINPDILFIFDGINDIWYDFVNNDGVSAALFESTYRQILDMTFTNNPDVNVVLIEPYFYDFGIAHDANPSRHEWKSRTDELCEIIRKIAGEYHGVYDVIHTQKLFDDALTRAPVEYWCNDGVHPTPAGHQLIAKECTSILCRLLKCSDNI